MVITLYYVQDHYPRPPHRHQILQNWIFWWKYHRFHQWWGSFGKCGFFTHGARPWRWIKICPAPQFTFGKPQLRRTKLCLHDNWDQIGPTHNCVSKKLHTGGILLFAAFKATTTTRKGWDIRWKPVDQNMCKRWTELPSRGKVQKQC